MEKKYIGFIPTNDGMVFTNSDGMLSERIGIAFIDCDGIITQEFIDEQGFINELPGEDPYDSIIAKKGSTVTLRNLSVAFEHADCIESVIEDAKKYFTVSTDGLDDTVVFKFDTLVCGKNHARLDVESESFPWLGTHFYDLSEPDFQIKGGKYHKGYSIKDYVVKVLLEYSKFIGKKVNVEVYFEKCTCPLDSEEDLKKTNREIEIKEDMFLPRLRRYIIDELDSAWNKRDEENERTELYFKKSKENAERFATKFDKDPNLM